MYINVMRIFYCNVDVLFLVQRKNSISVLCFYDGSVFTSCNLSTVLPVPLNWGHRTEPGLERLATYAKANRVISGQSSVLRVTSSAGL